LLAGRADVRVLPVENRVFGGTIGVAGLLTAGDLVRTLADQPEDPRYLLPDACLSKGVFLDGGSLDDLPRPVEVVATDGLSLRRRLDGTDQPTPHCCTAAARGAPPQQVRLERTSAPARSLAGPRSWWWRGGPTSASRRWSTGSSDGGPR